jgi:hypothetical protein
VRKEAVSERSTRNDNKDLWGLHRLSREQCDSARENRQH